MSKAKKLRFITILALAVLCVFTLGLAVSFLPSASNALAATYRPSSIFEAVSGASVDTTGAEGYVCSKCGNRLSVEEYEAASKAEKFICPGEKCNGKIADYKEFSHVAFRLPLNGRIEYRRDLALKWFVADEDAAVDPAQGGLANPGKEGFFSMSFAFAPAAFETRYVGAGEGVRKVKICPDCGYGAEGEEVILLDAETCPDCGYSFVNPIHFDTFEIAFQSAEENVTKDGQTTNSIYFAYDREEDMLTVEIHDASYEKGDTVESTVVYDHAAELMFEMREDRMQPGVFHVTLAENGKEAVEVGEFTNVGGYFFEYRSTSASSPQLPMAFEVTGADEDDLAQSVRMISLNGQSFEVNASGVIEDNAPAVLVVNEKLYSFRLGQKFSLTYEAIDVCDSSVTVSRQYYMLKYEAEETEEEGVEGAKHFVKPSDKDYSSLSASSTFFLPTDDIGEDEIAYVSIRFLLDDGTDANDTYVYLSWYTDPEANAIVTLGDEGYMITTGYKCPECGHEYTVKEYEKALEKAEDGETPKCPGEIDNPAYDPKAESSDVPATLPCTKTLADYEKQEFGNHFDYILVDRQAKGPAFAGLVADEKTNSNVSDWEKNENGLTAVEAYQDLVSEVAQDLSAGDGAYFYLPSLRALIGSSRADYRNLRFNIYYYAPSAVDGNTPGSATSLRYNNLRFEVKEVGLYTFRVVAQDAAGNTMKYYDKDGELVSITQSNVFDIEGIPEFTFNIDYIGPSIEESGTQTIGYNKQSYNISKFDVVALEGYEEDYELYFFENSNLEEGQERYSYKDLVELLDGIKDEITEGSEEYGWLYERFTLIRKFDDNISESDDKWDETDNDYAWDSDALRFTPQAVGIYVVRIKVVDGTYPGYSTCAYKAIDVTNESDILYGSSNWIRNNTTAIVLFAISALLLVIIILLAVIKPSDKKLEEVDLESLKGKKTRKDRE